MLAIVEKKKNKPGICSNLGCQKKTKGKFCSTCRKTKSRLKDPYKYAWSNLKSSAKRRGIYFDLTLEEFKEFAYETEYMKGKGRTINTLNVDRIVEGKLPGYTRSNIQALDKSKNVKKYFDWASKKTVTQVTIEFPPEDLPF